MFIVFPVKLAVCMSLSMGKFEPCEAGKASERDGPAALRGKSDGRFAGGRRLGVTRPCPLLGSGFKLNFGGVVIVCCQVRRSLVLVHFNMSC